jgi:peptidoglycan/LPS O-acetylase OafA/YrhL
VRRLGYVPALDGLRGAGIVTVIAVHYFGYPSGGYFSMEMFFALSGFLITTLLLEERDRRDRIGLTGFYRRRAYRLLPGLFTVFAVYAIATSASPLALKQIAAAGFYSANILGASGSWLLANSPFGPYWSLAQEEQFYLLWPLLLVFLLRRNVRESRIALALGCVFVALAVYRMGLGLSGASWYRIYLGPDTHSDGLVLGCLLALLRRRGLRVPQFAGWLSFVAFVAVFVFAPALPSLGAVAYGLAPMSVAGVLLVGAAVEPGLLASCFSLRPIVWLGTISYSLYLWHILIFWLCYRQPLLALPLTLGVATLSYYGVELRLRTAFRRRAEPVVEVEPVVGVGPAVEGEPVVDLQLARGLVAAGR